MDLARLDGPKRAWDRLWRLVLPCCRMVRFGLLDLSSRSWRAGWR